jgi:hypothetical protein
MDVPYKEFAGYILDGFAERVEKSKKDAVILNGDHVSRQFVLPVRREPETLEAFEARMVDFRKLLPRGNDQSYRLALAHEAFIRAGEGPSLAALSVFQELEKRPQVKFKIGTTRRGRRRKKKRPGFSATTRKVEMIRAEVSRYKREHEDFTGAFAKELGLYRNTFCRDAELYAQEESMYRDLLAKCEKDLSPCHQLTATYTVNLARALHEQRRFDDAIPMYRLGFARSMAARWAPHHRPLVMSSILAEIKNCQNRCPPAFSLSRTIEQGWRPKMYCVTLIAPACKTGS